MDAAGRLQAARRDDGGRRRQASERGGGPVSASRQPLLDAISARTAKVGIIGLGYVGLPLAVEFARAGFDVTGFDVDASKTGLINAGKSYIPDVPDEDLAAEVSAGRL